MTDQERQLDLFPGLAACEASAPRAPILRLQVVRARNEGSSPFALRQMRGSSDVYAAFRTFCDTADRESFWSVLLDVKHRVIAVEEVARGSLSSTVVHPRETFKSAVLVNAAAVVVVLFLFRKQLHRFSLKASGKGLETKLEARKPTASPERQAGITIRGSRQVGEGNIIDVGRSGVNVEDNTQLGTEQKIVIRPDLELGSKKR